MRAVKHLIILVAYPVAQEEAIVLQRHVLYHKIWALTWDSSEFEFWLHLLCSSRVTCLF